MRRGESASLEEVRAFIADTMLGESTTFDATLGEITLHAHQRSAARRLVERIEANGGAMLAEPVGLGKTFTSLAVAARFGGDIVIVAPAALREVWHDALHRCHMRGDVITHEALSRAPLNHESLGGGSPGVASPVSASRAVVIVDEAHRFRSPGTQRYAHLAELCRGSRLLLVTATPIQNRRGDLAAQIALYAGRRALDMTDEELAAHVVRGSSADDARTRRIPRMSGPHSLVLETVDDCLQHILALPPPVPARDETVVMRLLVYGLIHQWSSSRAALAAALRRRRARGLALASALDSGVRPTRSELAAWTHCDDALQLAFPELVTTTAPDGETDIDIGDWAVALDRHGAAIDALLGRMRATPDPDLERARLLRRLRAAHPGERIIAFCHYAETVDALRRILACDPGVAALTAHGARIASGRVPRDVVLRQFLPRGDRADVGRVERIDLLITTDLLSEGLNLQEASVVVHLDLPWNPARLDQRVGRARRLGSPHSTVTVYAMAPPAPAAELLRIEDRLRDKLRIAERTVGVAGRILPMPLAVPAGDALAERSGEIWRRLEDWRTRRELPARRCTLRSAPLVTAVRSELAGFLALISQNGESTLVAGAGGTTDDSAAAVVRALGAASGESCAPLDSCLDEAMESLERHLRARRASTAIDFTHAAAARSRRAALTRVAQAIARTPRHRRAQLAPLADAARAVATAPLGEGAERVLETLISSELSDEAWLRSIAAFGELNARPASRVAAGARGAPRVLALILFQPAAGSLRP